MFARPILLGGLLALTPAVSAPAQPAPPGRAGAAAAPCVPVRSIDAIRSVSPHGEIGLASERLAKLAGIRLPDGGDERARALALLGGHVGQGVAVSAAGDRPDRWGRILADIALADVAGGDLAAALLAAGLALVDAGEADRLCRPELLQVEAAARGRRVGVWAGERYRPAPVEDTQRLMALVGRFALVEGRVRSVGERRDRTYLNFSRDWASDTTVIIPKRSWAMLTGRGLTAATLRGRLIRARGIIHDWQGPAIEITAADMLEVLETERWRRR